MITSVEQCDSAFIEKLKGFSIDNAQGVPTEVPVIYISPEKEFVPSVLPCIVLYRSGMYPDNFRWSNERFYSDYVFDLEGNPISANERLAPEPYNIYYGIRFYTNYQIDMAKLTTFIHTRLKRGASLEIGGDTYEVSLVSYKNPTESYKDFGDMKEVEDRIFYEQYLYKIELELDINEKVEVDLTQQVIVNTTPSLKEGLIWLK